MLNAFRPLPAVVFCLVACSGAFLPAWAGEKESPGAMDGVRAAMLKRDFPKALKALEAHLKGRPKNADEALLLMARALALSKKGEKALAVLDRLIAEFPKSPHRIQALFRKADVLVELNRTDEALEIYEEQAKRVTSEARRLQMAEVYLKFADAFFKPKDEVKRPDYRKADLFFAKAMDMGLPADREAEVVLKRAEALSKLKKTRDARRLLASWRRAHPDHAKDADLALAQGEANLALRDRTGARRLFRDLLASGPPRDVAVKALFGIARSFRLPTPSSALDLELGVKALRDIITRFPGHETAPKAALEVGAAYAHLKRYHEACRELETFLASRLAKTGDKEVPQALHLLGLCRFSRKEYDSAIKVWRGFLSDHPTHELWTQVQKRVIDAEYAIGANRYAAKSYGPAREAWEKFLDAHPLDNRCRGILLLFGKGEHDLKRFEPAVAQWEKLVSKHPRTSEASEGLFLIGKTLEEDLGRFSDALEAYRKLDFGPFASRAFDRIQALEKKELRLRTERIFRTDEKPVVKVSTRNIEELEIRAWSVDLEAYFRKMHTARGVQDLDVPLIEPDRTWKVKVEPFEPYREIEREVPLPFEGPGVWAVNCTGADLEATTVVVRSDLALIIKGSRRNLLVFSQNMRTARPQPGVKVLVSDGKKILLEGKTDAFGTLLAEPEGIASVSSLRVLGAMGGSWASNTLDIRRLPSATGLSRRAYIFTDRPAYRPGDTAHLKAVIREVEKGVYAYTSGARYKIRVVDARGRLVRQGEAELTGFGTLDWTFRVPSNAPLGTYRVTVANKAGASFGYRFRVVEYRTPKLKVNVTVENPICYRGEKIKGKVRVSTFYGEPAGGRKVEIGFGHLPKLSLTTGAEGEVPFAFDTKEFAETQTVRLLARLPAEGVQGAANVHISTTGFTLAVKTLRTVYLVDEPFDLEVKATDMAGKPLSVPLEVGIYRLEKEEGRVSEVPVWSLKLTTKAVKKPRKATLRLSNGGRYRVRVRGRDRFGNNVTAETEMFISGKEDEVKIRILSDREEYRLGEAPIIDIHNRLKERPVLLTFEGERIFRYKVTRLHSGMNPFKIPMDAQLSPNFILSATVLDGPDIHEAQREFRVTRRLEVSVRCLDDAPGPGDKARIEVTTRDPMGNPVAAEVSVAMVDSAFLSLFPRKPADPATLFFTRRQRGCGTVATNTFSFEASTRKVLDALREEEKRLQQKQHRAKELKKLVERMRKSFRPEKDAPDSWKNDKSPDSRGRPKGSLDEEMEMEEAGKYQDLLKTKEGFVRRGEPGTVPAPTGGVAGKSFKGRYWNAGIGIGGGAGGRFGGYIFSLLEDIQAGLVETGYWNPRIVTGKNGRMVVEVPLPMNVTTWRLFAMGATKSLLVGTGEGDLTARKKLVVELKAPASLVEGDKAKVRVQVRNLSKRKVKVLLTLAWISDDGRQSLGTEDFEIPGNGEKEMVFEVLAEEPGTRTLSVLGVAGETMDSARERVRIHPKGTEVRRGWGGTATRDRRVRISIPKGDYAWRMLGITVGASLSRSLLEIGQAPQYVSRCGEPIVFFSPADRGLLALAKRGFLKATGRSRAGEWTQVEAIIEGAVAELAVTQHRYGGFGWTPKGSPNVYATGQAVRFLARAKNEGFPFDAGVLARCRAFLEKAFSSTEDNTVKAASMWALAHLDAGEFSFVNRLFRIRENLTPWAQAVLADTLVRMGRREMAAQVARMIEKKFLEEGPRPPGVRDKKQGIWSNRWVDSDRAEVLALSVLALCKALPESGRLGAGIDKLVSMKIGSVWPTGKATAAAAEAIGIYLIRVKAAKARYTLFVEVNDRRLAGLEMDRAAGARTVEVPEEAFKPGENFVSFKMRGVGRYTYRIEFLGFARGEDKSQKNRYVRIEREVHPQPMVLKGKEIPPGFGCAHVDPKERWVNHLGHLPEGGFGTVEIRFASREGEGYLVMEESLPGGAVLQEDSISGDFDHLEVRPGKIVFFLREGARSGRIRYRFFGYLPGIYATPAPRVWSAVEPTRLSTGTPGSLVVLKAFEKSPDPYRPTPDELLALGRARFNDKDFKGALSPLSELFNGFRLRRNTYGEAARMLLFCAVELNRPPEIVRYFEILKERFGSVEIPFDKTLVIAKAYRSLGESELALQIYQGLLEASFLKESNIAADLEDQGRILDSLAFTERLLREYPELPLLVGAAFALTQSVYDKAEGNAGELSRPQWIARAARMLRAFLAHHPTHGLSDEAGFSLANAYLTLKAGKMAGDLAEVLVKVHGRSTYLDEFHYLAALAYFRAHEWDRALRHASEVATGKFLTPDGAGADSPKKHLAVYIMGQIHHARGDFVKAMQYYKKVADRFADARASLEQFEWKRLFLPEVTLFKTGEEIDVNVTHRNLDSLDLLVYPVDLMKLYLMRKNLDEVASVNLAGIKPFHAEKVDVGKGTEYRDRETTVKLPVKKVGAYLVVAKGGGIEASGLVVLSDLKLEVQEDANAGRLRVTVRNEKTDRFEEDAHVKVVGSETKEFVSGDTDLRGVFEAGSLVGTATVIVKKQTSYAFFRGETVHRPLVALRRRASRGAAFFGRARKGAPTQTLTLGEQVESRELLEEALSWSNRAMQKRNVQDLRRLTRRKQKGMQAQQAKRK